MINWPPLPVYHTEHVHLSNVSEGSNLILEDKRIHSNIVWDKPRLAFMPKTSLIYSAISIQPSCDRQTDRHITYTGL